MRLGEASTVYKCAGRSSRRYGGQGCRKLSQSDTGNLAHSLEYVSVHYFGMSNFELTSGDILEESTAT